MISTLEIVLIGSGSYVCGKNMKDFGTILPAILTFSKLNTIPINIVVAINSKNSANKFMQKLDLLNKLISTKDLINCKFIFCEGSPENFLSKYEIKEGLVAGIISIPDHLHYKWSEALIKAKIPLLVVKPLTLKLSESIKLFDLSKKLSTPVFVEFHKRFDKQLKFAKDSFINGLIGQPLYSYTEYTQKKKIPLENFKDWAYMSNIFSYLGVHYVDALRFITNAKPKRVCATGQKYFLIQKGLDTFDSVQCNIEWEIKTGIIFNQCIICSWIESNKSSSISKQDFHIIGTNGRLDCEQKERGLKILTDNNSTEDINPDFTKMYSYMGSNIFEGYGIDSVKTFLGNVINKNYNSNDNRICNLEESLYSTSVIEAATESLNRGSIWIDINSII